MLGADLLWLLVLGELKPRPELDVGKEEAARTWRCDWSRDDRCQLQRPTRVREEKIMPYPTTPLPLDYTRACHSLPYHHYHYQIDYA